MPTLKHMERAFRGWLDEIEADSATRTNVINQLRNSLTGESHLEPLEATLAAMQIARPEIQSFIDRSRKQIP